MRELKAVAFVRSIVAAIAFAFIAFTAHAQPATNPKEDKRVSAFQLMSPATQAMQRDDTQNPAMLWAEEGRGIWRFKPSAEKKSCADCHGDAEKTMRGIAATYPKYSGTQKRVLNLNQQIEVCQRTRQQKTSSAETEKETLALETFITQQSRGMPITLTRSPALSRAQREGKSLYERRMGQLGMSCKDCHDDLAGKRLAGTTIPQGHPTAYPIYRLEWQEVGGLHRRLRACMVAVRAEPFAANSKEFVALEAYLMQRAAGMTIESPGVRP
jgi:L-cysteine S-thiosulfotransferase